MKAKGIEMVKPRDMPKALIKNLDEKVFKEVKNLLELSDTKDLTDWESKFVNDQKERLEKYGEKILMSDKQLNVLRKIADK
tara:strand:- start:707 stop:949 length:243 start_codon:yes stop_codon:yes gene_type:complete